MTGRLLGRPASQRLADGQPREAGLPMIARVPLTEELAQVTESPPASPSGGAAWPGPAELPAAAPSETLTAPELPGAGATTPADVRRCDASLVDKPPEGAAHASNAWC
jgi:hypothetical protein